MNLTVSTVIEKSKIGYAILVGFILTLLYLSLDKYDSVGDLPWVSKLNNLLLETIPSLLATLIGFIAVYILIKKFFGVDEGRGETEYPPNLFINKNKYETAKFMKDFIESASGDIIIVSKDLTWLDEEEAQEVIETLVSKKAFVQILTKYELPDSLKKKLEKVQLFQFDTDTNPHARFTMINETRQQSAQVAIARGTHPNHQITVYDSVTGPHIVALTMDLVAQIRKAARRYA